MRMSRGRAGREKGGPREILGGPFCAPAVVKNCAIGLGVI